MDHLQNPNSLKPADRKTVERNRRNQMKSLYSRLSSLVPNPSHREAVSLQAQLEGATSYIKNLEAKLEKMKLKKSCLIAGGSAHSNASRSNNLTAGGVNAPSIDVRVQDSAVYVTLITGLNCRFMFTEAIRVLHEEGAEVVNASFSVLNNTVFHNIHSQIGDEFAQHSTATAISERIRKLILCSNSVKKSNAFEF